MESKAVKEVSLELGDCINYLGSENNTQKGKFKELFLEVHEEIKELIDDRWIQMEQEDMWYDHKIGACWPLLEEYDYIEAYDYDDFNDLKDKIKDYFKEDYCWELPEFEEISISIYNDGGEYDYPFKRDEENIPYLMEYCPGEWRCLKGNELTKFGLYEGEEINDDDYSALVPLFRLGHLKNSEEALVLFLKNKLIPKKLKNREKYIELIDSELIKTLDISSDSLNAEQIKEIYENNDISELKIDNEKLSKILLCEDTVRANLAPYNSKLLENLEQGHWSLWRGEETEKNKTIKITLDKPLYARDPRTSINEGIIGIDFGTKSTVVAYQGKNTNIYPLRVGVNDLAKEVDSHHYENPTIMEFADLNNFMNYYNERIGRPFTRWSDLTVSHTAFETLKDGSKSDEINTFFYELKQWAGNKQKKLRLLDKKGVVKEVAPYLELGDTFDPIEIYAYYLGLYINNQNNGIYTNYSLSFPVTYEVEVREKILNSFEKGIKKSMPYELHKYPEEIERVRVKSGASEPAAYSVVALQEYGFEPEDDEKVFYGIFDFGGGTTDFDFGVWREAEDNRRERRYEYVVEHFGANGDRYLGGENILELLAYEVFKDNKSKLLNNEHGVIEFRLPAGVEDRVSGLEGLVSLKNESREAKMNMRQLMEKLRGFWERHEGYETIYQDEIKCKLVTREEVSIPNFELDIDTEKLNKIIRDRIEQGVVNFFESIRLAFGNKNIDLNSIEKINIFLAGNSSKAEIVKELFDEYMEKETLLIQKEQEIEGEIFELFPPLGSREAYTKMKELGIEKEHTLESPTSKTGVAYGLIHCREGGNILVNDINTEEGIMFKYYLGRAKKNKFKVSIPRELPYNEWSSFIDAGVDTFEVYYTDQPMASNGGLAIESALRKSFIIGRVDENADIFIRRTEPTKMEYVVAYEEGIRKGEYLTDIVEVELN